MYGKPTVSPTARNIDGVLGGNSLQHIFVGFAYGTFLLETGDDGCPADFVLRSPTPRYPIGSTNLHSTFSARRYLPASRENRSSRSVLTFNIRYSRREAEFWACLTIVQMR
jgi:hypothetical protein